MHGARQDIQCGWRQFVLLLGVVALVALVACTGGSDQPTGDGNATSGAGSTNETIPSGPVTFDGELPALPGSIAGAATAGTPIITWVAHAGARLEPCGCVAGMHGGLVRRASLLHRLDEAFVLSLECGGWTGGAADYQLVRAGYYLRGFGLAGGDAVGLGRAEVALGAEQLRSIVADSPVPVVAANVQATEGEDFLVDSTSVQLGDREVVITSVVPATARGAGLQVGEPAEAVLAVQAAHPGRLLVVIADLDAVGLRELATAVPGLGVLIGGDVEQPSPNPIAVGATRIVHVANEGKTIGYWPLGDEACTFELITDDIPDHPHLRELVHQYQETLAGMDLAIDDRVAGMTTLQGGDEPENHYVGSAICSACHPNAAAIHKDSRHFHSLETLVEKNYHHDPDCLRCHVTGLAMRDGFSRKEEREGMGQVSCEACHGRGAIHVRERSAGRAASGSLAVVTPATCTRCHDGENSPHFIYDPYWDKIEHGTR